MDSKLFVHTLRAVTLSSIVLCVLSSLSAQEVITREKWLPEIPPNLDRFTPSCRREESASFVADVFNHMDANRAMKNPKISVIIGHSFNEINEPFVGGLAFVEHVPIYANASRALENLSSNELFKILRGDVRSWSELGAGSGPIQLYLHSGILQKRSLDKVLEQFSVSSKNFTSMKPYYATSYEQLGIKARQDPNALVVGLKESDLQGLNLLSIDGISIRDSEKLDNYVLKNRIYMYTKDTQHGVKFLQKFIDGVLMYQPR